MNERRYLYVLSPIDDWTGWMDAEKSLESLEPWFRQGIEDALAPAQKMITAHRYFEHETHLYPWYVSPLPKDDDGYCAWMVATKITNNGTTFLVSPYELPWLGAHQ
jgi:hypothetical protein